ncbi:MAG: antibiotic biosynthesis monooxygenase family protein, partial [Nitrospiraceae bacterium]
MSRFPRPALFRVFRATIRPAKVDAFRDMLERLSIPMVKAADGMLSYYVGEPLDPAVPEFTVTTLWKDLDSLKAFAGENWNRSVIPPEEVPLIAESFI